MADDDRSFMDKLQAATIEGERLTAEREEARKLHEEYRRWARELLIKKLRPLIMKVGEFGEREMDVAWIPYNCTNLVTTYPQPGDQAPSVREPELIGKAKAMYEVLRDAGFLTGVHHKEQSPKANQYGHEAMRMFRDAWSADLGHPSEEGLVINIRWPKPKPVEQPSSLPSSAILP